MCACIRVWEALWNWTEHRLKCRYQLMFGHLMVSFTYLLTGQKETWEMNTGAEGFENEIIISFLSGCDYKLFYIIST